MKPIIAIDCETGGLDETKNALLSVGLVELDGNYNPVRLKEVFIKPIPGMFIDDEAAKLNGYSMEEWEKNSALDLREAFNQILLWLPSEFTFIAHNSSFDEKFFLKNIDLAQAEFRTTSVKFFDWECTKKLYQSIAGDPCNLSSAAIKVGHWPEDYSRIVHGALIDALACAAVYKWCKKYSSNPGVSTGLEDDPKPFPILNPMKIERNDVESQFDKILEKLK